MVPPQTDLGQHLLVDDAAIARVIDAARLRPGERVLDAGAGRGALMRPIADAVGPTGRVYAVEIDARMLEVLRTETPEQVRVVEKDLIDVTFPERLDAVVANPPFKIAAHLVQRLVAACVPRAVLVLPRELIDRLAARPGSERYGRLTIQIRLLARVEDLGIITRHAFAPPPNVPCGLLRLSAREDVHLLDPELLEQVLTHAAATWTEKATRSFDLLARSLRIDSARLIGILKDEGWADGTVSMLPPDAFGRVVHMVEDLKAEG